MKKILIMGCSWGVPNYYGPPGVPAKYHTEFLLRDAGFDVRNAAINGGSNISTLIKAQSIISNWEPDWIIWFHTAANRELSWYSSSSLVEADQKTYSDIYRKYKKFASEHPVTKWIIIGANAAIHSSYYTDPWHQILIPCWKSQIAKFELPQLMQDLRGEEFAKVIDQATDPTVVKLMYLNANKTILNYLEKNNDFPDGSHPGIRPHKELVEQLMPFIRN